MKTVLYLKGTEKGLNKLKRLHETGELTNILGYKVLNIQEYQEPIKPVYQRLETLRMGWAMSAAVAVLIVCIIAIYLFQNGWYSDNHNLIDTSYQIVSAKKPIEVVAELRQLAFLWEQSPDSQRGSAAAESPSLAEQAFRAGILTGRLTLLEENRQVVLPPLLSPPAPYQNWLTTEQAPYFELGRWILLLWAAVQIDAEIQQPFWEQQRAILAELQAAWAARTETDSDAAKVVSKLQPIEKYLKKLPAGETSEIDEEFRFELNQMMEKG